MRASLFERLLRWLAFEPGTLRVVAVNSHLFLLREPAPVPSAGSLS